MKRAVDLSTGIAFVVSDLHGAWEPYARYRDHFLDLYERRQADILILLGDVIHGYGTVEEDFSLHILWDIMRLQQQLGQEAVIALLGNHELPHIYGVMLSKGGIEFTPRFERALGENRGEVIDFLKTLPFLIRTSGGVLMTHAGAAASVTVPEVAVRLLDFSHEALLNEARRLAPRDDVLNLIQMHMGLTADDYDRMARHYLAVDGPGDPRYYDLLYGLIASNLKEWVPLWDFFFTQCEQGMSRDMYRKIVDRFLKTYSEPNCPQMVLVTGHISTKDGYEVVEELQLRLASWAHATPKNAGCYLLLDVSRPVESAADLLPFIHPMP